MTYSIKIPLFLFILIWCAGIFIETFIHMNDNLPFLYLFMKKSYSTVCHQNSAKLIELGIGSTMVCSRCTGIYLGIFMSSVITLFITVQKTLDIKFLFFASIPLLIDVIFSSLGIYEYSKTAALITGILWGWTAFLYFYNGLENYILEINKIVT